MKDSIQKTIDFKRKCILFLIIICVVGFVIDYLVTQDMYSPVILGRDNRTKMFTWKAIFKAKEILTAIKHRFVDTNSTMNETGRKGSYRMFNPRYDVTTISSLTTLQFDPMKYWRDGNTNALAVYLLSVIGLNSTSVTGYINELNLQGWLGMKHFKTRIKCCIYWGSNVTTEYKNPSRVTRGKFHLSAVSFTCPVRGSLSEVKGVALQYTKVKCQADKTVYMKPSLAKIPTSNNSFAICLKILYGNVKSNLLLDWIEFYREMEVDKIFMYVYNITRETDFIIKHYTTLGIIETRKYDFPLKKGNRTVGMKTQQVWQDEQVVVYDCYYRLHNYNYFAIVDLDEFLLPRNHTNIKEMMKYLMTKNPNAAGFTMRSYIFNKDWGPTGRVNGSDAVRYIQRTFALAGMKSRPKNIIIPERICVDRLVYTHDFKPKDGFLKVLVNETIASLNHYRNCYPNLSNACDKRRSVIDVAIVKILERIQNRTLWFNDHRHDFH